MYGEATSGSLWKIWGALTRFVGIRPDDIVVDWGWGWSDALFQAVFLPLPNIRAIGVELDKSSFEKAEQNLASLGEELKNTNLIHTDSTTFHHWDPVTIAIQYDGPANPYLQEYHRTIMTNLFETPTIRAVFSTKLNLSTFIDYFDNADTVVVLEDWRLMKLTGLNFGVCSYLGNLWIRNRPSKFSQLPPDPRIRGCLGIPDPD
jgi:hypothetical protein